MGFFKNKNLHMTYGFHSSKKKKKKKKMIRTQVCIVSLVMQMRKKGDIQQL